MSVSRLMGRKKELAALAASTHEADRGHGCVVLLAGEAGLGKTSLAQEALRRSGHAVVAGRARLDVTIPYGPIVSVLRDHHRRQEGAPTSALSSYLALLLPELGPAPANPGAPKDHRNPWALDDVYCI